MTLEAHGHSHAIDHAIAEAQRGVFDRQSDDGAWRTCDRAGPPTTGWALVALRYLGVLGRYHRFDPAGAIRFVLSTELPSGAFPDYPGDTAGTLASTCACYAGLYAAGVDVRSAPMDLAWRFIKGAGGFASADAITQTFLAAAGLYDPSMLPDLPLGVMLLPITRRAMARTVSTAFQLIMLALPGLVRGLRARRRFPAPKDDLVGWAERRKLIDRLKELQDPIGHWLGTLFHTGLCAMTLHALGLPTSDASISCALGCIDSWRFPVEEHGDDEARVPAQATGDAPWRFVPYTSETWNGALCVSALVRSGVAPDDPRIRRAVAFILSAQGRIDEPIEWQNPAPCAPRRGGFPFEAQNTFNLDCDSTGQVLRALQVVPGAPSVAPTMREALAWLDGMQNPDGGWPSFTRGQAHKLAGPYPLGIFTVPETTVALLSLAWTAPLFFGDPATEDLTGRVLQALGGLGRRVDDPRIRRAVDFLRGQIFDNGVWWGRWECNYLPSTAYVLLGLMAVGVKPDEPYVARAVRWVADHQNDDGGFGETIDSYGNLGLAGVGLSNAYTTGLVVSALLAARGDAQVIDRAVAYLLKQQRKDGLWPAGSYELVVNAPLPFYRIPADVWTAPLQALADYRARANG